MTKDGQIDQQKIKDRLIRECVEVYHILPSKSYRYLDAVYPPLYLQWHAVFVNESEKFLKIRNDAIEGTVQKHEVAFLRDSIIMNIPTFDHYLKQCFHSPFEPSNPLPILKEDQTEDALRDYVYELYLGDIDIPRIKEKMQCILGTLNLNTFVTTDKSLFLKACVLFYKLSQIRPPWAGLCIELPPTIRNRASIDDATLFNDLNSSFARLNVSVANMFKWELLQGMNDGPHNDIKLLPFFTEYLLHGIKVQYEDVFHFIYNVEPLNEAISIAQGVTKKIFTEYLPSDIESGCEDDLRIALVKSQHFNQLINRSYAKDHFDDALTQYDDSIANTLLKTNISGSNLDICKVISDAFGVQVTEVPLRHINEALMALKMVALYRVGPLGDVEKYYVSINTPNNILIMTAIVYETVHHAKKVKINIMGETSGGMRKKGPHAVLRKVLKEQKDKKASELDLKSVPESIVHYWAERFHLATHAANAKRHSNSKPLTPISYHLMENAIRETQRDVCRQLSRMTLQQGILTIEQFFFNRFWGSPRSGVLQWLENEGAFNVYEGQKPKF